MKTACLAVCAIGIMTGGLSVYADETLDGAAWTVTAAKGELTGVSVKGVPLVGSLGSFRVVGKDVRPFKEVSSLRQGSRHPLVYEGIADDGEHHYVEFGQVIEVGEELTYLLFLSWLPPSTWPPDAVSGTLTFAPGVSRVRTSDIPPDAEVLASSQDVVAELNDGQRVRIRVEGIDPEKSHLQRTPAGMVLSFEEARDYVAPVTDQMNRRTLSYWTSSTDTHYIRITFTVLPAE